MQYVRGKLLIGLFLFATVAFASPKTTTFQMKIVKPDGTPLTAASVNFQFTTLSPTGTCVLYVEQFSAISMVASQGLAVINLGSGTQAYSGYGTGYTDIYNNNSASMNCQGSGSFIPTSLDRRRIVVQFNDGSAAGWQSLPAIDINSVPYANFSSDSEKFGGKIVTDFISSTTLPGSACVGSQVLTYNGTTFTCVTAPGTGTVTNVTSANAYLSVATGTTTPALTLNVGTVANTVAAGNDGRIVGAAQKANNLSDLASVATARTNLGLGTAALLDSGAAANNLVQLDGTAKIPVALLPAAAVTTSTALVGDVTGTIGATVVSLVGTKTAAQVAQSVVDTLAATNANTASTIVKRDGAGTIAVTNLSATNVSTQNSYLYDGTNTNRVLLKAPFSGITNYTMTLPPAIGTANQILGYDAAGAVLENKSITAGAGITVTHSAGGIQISSGAGAGTVTSVTSANADIGVATTTSTPVLTLNSGTAANQILKLDGTAKIPAVDGSLITNLDPTHLSAAVAVNKGGTGATTAAAALNNLLPAQATNSGKVLGTDGTNASWVATSAGTVTSVTSANSYLTVATTTTTPVVTAVVGTAANTLAAGDDSRIVNAVQQSAYNGDIANVLDSNCGIGSTPKWNIVGDMWTCVAIGGLPGSAITTGTVAAARLGSGTADATTYLRGDGAWTAPPTSQWTTTGSDIYYNTGKVGIGTTSPDNSGINASTLLHVAGSGTNRGLLNLGTSAGLSGGPISTILSSSATNRIAQIDVNTDNGFTDRGSLQIYTSPSGGGPQSRMIVSSAGNVGIGTTSPAERLQVGSASNPTNTLETIKVSGRADNVVGDVPFANLWLNNESAGGGGVKLQASHYMDNYGGRLDILIGKPNGVYGGTVNNLASTMTILGGSGNVGIGTTSPVAPLDVVTTGGSGHVQLGSWLSDPTAGALYLNGAFATANSFNMVSGPQNLYINRPTGGFISFRENNAADQMIIASGGNVGIGITSPTEKLHVVGTDATGNGIGVYVRNTDTSGNSFSTFNMRVGAGSNGGMFFGSQSSNDGWGIANGLTFRAGTSSQDIGLSVGANTTGGGTGPNVILKANGNVGIGTITPTAKLEINGQMRTVASTGAAKINAGAAIDWNNGNAQSMSVACTATTFTNMLDAGTYVLAVTETGTSTCVFSQAGLTFYFNPANGNRTSGQRTVYTFQRIGNDVYVSWIPGFQ